MASALEALEAMVARIEWFGDATCVFEERHGDDTSAHAVLRISNDEFIVSVVPRHDGP
jgi:hypothetical protein